MRSALVRPGHEIGKKHPLGGVRAGVTRKVSGRRSKILGEMGTIGSGSPPPAAPEAVFAFVDLSNVWYGVGPVRDRLEPGAAIRLSSENLGALLAAGRAPYRQVTVANADVPSGVITYFERFGPVLLCEAGKRSGTEQANDETLQVRMYEAMHQQPRSVMVLATGDGAGWTQRRGFIPALEAARQHRWAVEVVSWGGITNGALIDWVQRVGGVFIDLEAHYYSEPVNELDGVRLDP